MGRWKEKGSEMGWRERWVGLRKRVGRWGGKRDG